MSIKKEHKKISGIIFALLDNHNDKANEIAWQLCKPNYEQPFKSE